MATVLIVDDDPFISGLASAKARQLGHQVEVAENGEDGLRMALSLQPDLIVLDLMMPKLTGIEVCRSVRAVPAMRATPIIMLTGKGQERDIEEGFAAGATDYLVKPFSPREFQTRVRALLDRAAAVGAAQ